MANYNINAVTRRVVYSGSAGLGPYAFSFEILVQTDVDVYFNATLLTLSTDYTVTINANGTGSITIVTGTNVPSTPTASDQIAIVGARDIERTTDFVTAGELRAAALNEQLDGLTIFDQQLLELTDRAITAPITDPISINMTLPAKDARKGKYLAFNETTGDPEVGATIDDIATLAEVTDDIATLADIEDGTDATDAIQTVAGIAANVSTVAGISSNVSTVASNTSNINTVAGISADVTAVAADSADIQVVADIATEIAAAGANSANINTVAGNIANVNTVAGVSGNVTTVAGISGNVTTVAGISSDVTAVAADATDIGTVAAGIANVNTVGGNMANVNTVAGISGNVTTVAGVSANVTTVAGISGNVTTVAGISSDIPTVAADSADIAIVSGGINNVTTVAGSITNVNNVGGSIANVNTVATNITDVVTFATTYLGAFASAPSTTVTGALYYNTSVSQLYVWDGAAWDAAAFTASGAVTSFNTRTGAVTLSSADVTGALTYTPVDPAGDTMTGNLSFGDNNKAIFGAGSDLQIYHDGSNSYISDQGTGNLRIAASDRIQFYNAATDEVTAQFIANGEAELRYDNTTRLSTTSTGIDVTGTVTADGLTVDTSDPVLRLTDSDTGETATVKTSGAGHLILDASQANAAGNGNVYVRTQASTLRALFNYNGDIAFYDSTGTSQNLFWDASASRLGIGTTSPSTILTLDSGGTPTTLKIDSLTESSIDFDDQGGSAKRYKIGTNISSNDGQFEFKDMTANAERMRLTSTGQLLIGRTATSGVADGHRFDANGFTQHVRDGGEALEVVRETSDGNLVVFKKDSTTVGSIASGSSGTELKWYGAFASGAGLGIYSNLSVRPLSNTGAAADGTVTLGHSSQRFKDLYLSGGVYLGGTGGANHLDDYEEGTWTPVSTGVTFASASGTYRKIGNMVFATFNVTLAASQNANYFQLNGLPFTHAGSGGDNMGSIGNTDMGTNEFTVHVNGTGTAILLRNLNDTDYLRYNSYPSKNIRGGVLYRT